MCAATVKFYSLEEASLSARVEHYLSGLTLLLNRAEIESDIIVTSGKFYILAFLRVAAESDNRSRSL